MLANSAIEMAIIKSDPVILKQELDEYTTQGKSLSKREQLKY